VKILPVEGIESPFGLPAHVPKCSVAGHPDFESRDSHPQMKIWLILVLYNVILNSCWSKKEAVTNWFREIHFISFVAEQLNAEAGCSDSHFLMSCGNWFYMRLLEVGRLMLKALAAFTFAGGKVLTSPPRKHG